MFFIYLYKKCLAFTNALAIYLCLLITPTIIVRLRIRPLMSLGYGMRKAKINDVIFECSLRAGVFALGI